MYRPLDTRVMVELLPPTTKLLDHYSLPQGSILPPSEGIVVGIGSNVHKVEKIKLGEKVLFDKKFGVNIIENDITYRILEIRDIFAIK